MLRSFAILGLFLALPACAGGSGTGGGAARPTISTQPTLSQGFKRPAVQSERGLGSVIGQGAPALLNRFGTARIDLSEGDARKLQFASDRCVLDIYLYPLAAGQDPVATHVEARERRGGQSVDKADCMAEVLRR